MSARRAVWEVARREIVERSRSRALHISLAVLLLFAVGGAVAAARLRGHTPTDPIAVSGARSVALEPAIRLQAKAVGRRVHVRQLSNGAAAREVRSGTVALALIDGDRSWSGARARGRRCAKCRTPSPPRVCSIASAAPDSRRRRP